MMQATTGQMPEWSKGEDLRSSSIALRGFEPHSGHDHEQPVWTMGSVWAEDVKQSGQVSEWSKEIESSSIARKSAWVQIPPWLRQWITGLESFQKNRLLVWVPSAEETLNGK